MSVTKTNTPVKSFLVIAPEDTVSDAIGAALKGDANVRVDHQTSTLAGMNGRAVKALGDYDVILFQTSPDDSADMRAIEALVAHRRGGTRLVALADGNISLAQARALSDAGVDEVLPLPVAGAPVDGSLARLARSTDRASAAQTQGRIIAVAQARGGAGSTTLAVNLADQLIATAPRGRKAEAPRIALVDLDLQFGTVGSLLDLPEQDMLLQLALDGTIPDDTFLAQSMQKTKSSLHVLAAPSKFAPLDALRPEQVAAILDTLRATHDYVVVDLPRALVSWIEPVVQRADEMILVTDLSVPSVRHCRRLIEFFTQDNLALPVEVVVSRQTKPLFGSRMQKEAAKALDRTFTHWLPDDPKAAGIAADRGQPLSAVASRSALAKAIQKLAKSIRTALPVAAHQSK